jgi:hypothetical protein
MEGAKAGQGQAMDHCITQSVNHLYVLRLMWYLCVVLCVEGGDVTGEDADVARPIP